MRGELYTREHLDAHAVELAGAHGAPISAKTPGPLRRRVAQAKQRIYEAYQVLGRATKQRRESSPAEEWLLDNANVVQDQLREIAEDLPFGYLIELPRIARGAMQGYPRVYGLCIDYLRHTDGRVDVETLASFVRSYQSVAPLTIGELWAVPIMLRIGLILIVGALASSEASAEDSVDADLWAERLLRVQTDPVRTGTCLLELERTHKRLSATFLVQLLRRLREADTSLELTRDWLAQRCAAMGTNPDELKRREHLRQAADQVSVGNAITSMRAVSALDWDDFFERTSAVEAVLKRDPAACYALSDKATRDRYRHAVEDLARHGKQSELGVAERALTLAQVAMEQLGEGAPSTAARAHVGYFLVDAGRSELEREIGYRPSLSGAVVRAVCNHPGSAYFVPLTLLTIALTVATVWLPIETRWSFPVILLGGLALLPASEIALALVNALLVTVLPPRRLAKLDFSNGIPDEHLTLVVVPVLIDSPKAIDHLVEELEVRALANPDPNLKFAILSDFLDAERAEIDSDAPLLERMQQRMREVNQRHGLAQKRFWLLHRRRVHNPSEGRYMGWERKRGKLHELGRLLRGATDTTFSVVSAQPEVFASIRYVITLDADTDLPRDAAAKLVGCLAHPLNVPVLDGKLGRVVRGHAILQPRVGTLPKSSRRTRYSALLTGPSGIDPYTTLVSDTYQDLFAEGSFVGKGIYHVDAFHAALAGRVPDNRILSHDLFEGVYARSALVTDIEVLDEQPTSYAVHASRQHRWMRGDWQLLPWLLPRVPAAGGTRSNDLRLLDYWKIADNLRRSLLAPALVALSIGSWFIGQPVAQAVALLIAAVYLVPVLARLPIARS